MPHEILYDERGDLVYPVKLIVDENVDSEFSVDQVMRALGRYGYQSSQSFDPTMFGRRDRTHLQMRRDDVICQISRTEVAFSQKIPDDEIERIRAELHALLVTRVEILSNAAEQNASSALINLLQNQRRACVSDTYYALHNAIAALQEHYLIQGNLDSARIPDELSRDTPSEESRLGHCSPAIARAVVSEDSLRLLWEEETEDILSDSDHLRAASPARDRDPHRSPFVWLGVMLRELIQGSPPSASSPRQPRRKLRPPALEEKTHVREMLALAGQVGSRLRDVQVDSLGIGGKNDAVEKDFKDLHQEIINLLDQDLAFDESYTRFREALLAFSDFLMYAQILRLSGDYDSSFEIKMRVQDIVSWTLISVQFVNLVTAYIRREPIVSESLVKHLPTRCDRRLLGGIEDLVDQFNVTSFGGAIQAHKFDLVEVVKELHRSHDYSLSRIDGRTQNVTPASQEITIWKTIPGFTQLACFLKLSRNGLYWLEVVNNPFEASRRAAERVFVNTYYLNLILDRVVLRGDILRCLPEGSVIYRAVSETPQVDADTSYCFLLDNLAERFLVPYRIDRIVDYILERETEDVSHVLFQTHWIRSRAAIRRSGHFLSRRVTEGIREADAETVVVIVAPLVDLGSADQELIEENVHRTFQRRIENREHLEFRVEFLTVEALDSVLMGDIALLKALITSIVERAVRDDSKSGLLIADAQEEPDDEHWMGEVQADAGLDLVD